MKRRYFSAPIDRGVFLEARMAYLAHERNAGESYAEMMRSCNVHDDGQVLLLLMTWDESEPPKEDITEQVLRAEIRSIRGQRHEADAARYNELIYKIVDPGFVDKRTPAEAHASTVKHVEWLKGCAELLDQIERADHISDDLLVKVSRHFGRTKELDAPIPTDAIDAFGSDDVSS